MPTAALARETGDRAPSPAYAFLKAISVSDAVPAALRLKSLKAIAGIESVKPGRNDPDMEETERRTAIAMINAARQRALRQASVWNPAVQWFLTASDDVAIPQLEQCVDDLDELLAMPETELQRRADERHALL